MWSLFGCSGVMQTCGRVCQRVATAGAARRAGVRAPAPAPADVAVGPAVIVGRESQSERAEDAGETEVDRAVPANDDEDRDVRVEEDDDQPVLAADEQQPEDGPHRVQVVDRRFPVLESEV